MGASPPPPPIPPPPLSTHSPSFSRVGIHQGGWEYLWPGPAAPPPPPPASYPYMSPVFLLTPFQRSPRARLPNVQPNLRAARSTLVPLIARRHSIYGPHPPVLKARPPRRPPQMGNSRRPMAAWIFMKLNSSPGPSWPALFSPQHTLPDHHHTRDLIG